MSNRNEQLRKPVASKASWEKKRTGLGKRVLLTLLQMLILKVLNSKQGISRYSSWAHPNTKRKLPRLSCHITECRGKATRGASSEEASYEKLQRMEKTGGKQESNEQDMRTEWSQLTLTKDSKFTLKAAKASRLRVYKWVRHSFENTSSAQPKDRNNKN